jgi:hypothetical protein
MYQAQVRFEVRTQRHWDWTRGRHRHRPPLRATSAVDRRVATAQPSRDLGAQTSVRRAPHSDQVTAAPSHQSSEASDCSKAGRGRFAPLGRGYLGSHGTHLATNVHDARCIVDRHGRTAHHTTLCVSTMLGSQPVGPPLAPLLVGTLSMSIWCATKFAGWGRRPALVAFRCDRAGGQSGGTGHWAADPCCRSPAGAPNRMYLLGQSSPWAGGRGRSTGASVLGCKQ